MTIVAIILVIMNVNIKTIYGSGRRSDRLYSLTHVDVSPIEPRANHPHNTPTGPTGPT